MSDQTDTAVSVEKPSKMASISRLVIATRWLLIAPASMLLLLSLAGDAYRHICVVLAMFGLWSGSCVAFGLWIERNRQALKMQGSAEQMFNWIRTGKTSQKQGDEKPPVAMYEPSPHRPSGGAAI